MALAMNIDFPTHICDRCGEETYQRRTSLQTISKLNGTKEDYILTFMELDGVPREVAEEWIKHGLYESCKKKEADCPYCGSKLKTWEAKQCLNCGKDWHSSDPSI